MARRQFYHRDRLSVYSRICLLAAWCTWIAASALSPSTALAQPLPKTLPPYLNYQTIETEHFLVHFHDGTEDFAYKVAINCEEAHKILVPLIEWEPLEKTQVVITDKLDSANGAANTFGRNHINIFAMPPTADSVLGFFDDWVRILVYHEYVHILHLDTVYGVPAAINKVIGKQILPNQTAPRWYTEGYATYQESRRTRGGRVDGSLFRMYLRTAVLEDRLYDLGATSGLPATWPGGSAAYLYGSAFLDYVFRKHGEDFAPKFHERYGRRLLPWGLNNIARDITGDDFDTLWAEWTAELSAQARATELTVRSTGETRLEWITKSGGTTGFPTIDPKSGDMAFYRFDNKSKPEIAVFDPGEKKIKTHVELPGSGGKFTISPNGEWVVFSASGTIRNTYRYRDLWARSTKTGSVRRLTEGERAHDPEFSADGKSIAFVKTGGGSTTLVVKKFAHMSGKANVVIDPTRFDGDGRWQQISSPSFSPDGTQLVFSWWRLDTGQRDLWSVDLKTNVFTQLTNDFALDVDPHWDASGQIYFSSDRTGIFNAFTLSPQTGQVTQLSNVVAGIFAPRPGEAGWVYARSYGADGFDLVRFKPTPRVAKQSTKEFPKLTYPSVDTTNFTKRDYAPLKYLAPLIFSPVLATLTSGTGFGGSIQGNDPVGRHSYLLSGGITFSDDPLNQTNSLSLSYRYAGLPVSTRFSGVFFERPRGRSLFEGNQFVPYLQRQISAFGGIGYDFSLGEDSLSIAGDFILSHEQIQNVGPFERDPGDLEPVRPEVGWFNGVGLSLSYGSTESFPQSVTPESGYRARLSLDVRDPVLGADFRRTSLGFRGDIYIENPWWERHALNLHYDAGTSYTNQENRRLYALGGNSPQDVFTSVLFFTPRSEFVVRGFEPNISRGSTFQLAGMEYRFPIYDFETGFSTLPVFLRQIKGSVFLETGAAYDGFASDADFLTGFGAELSLETLFAYYLAGNLRLGYGRGLGEFGQNEFYLVFGGGF